MKIKKTCAICRKEFEVRELISGDLLGESVLRLIREKHPEWNQQSLICGADLNHFRSQYIRDVIEEDMGELTQLEVEVIRSIKEQELIADNLNTQYEEGLTFGDRVADKMALFGGSWKFVCVFASILFGWIFINASFIAKDPFDPYPYILLNLVLSCLAAIQAPVIMMSQNRQSIKDRMRAEMDYKLNLKAELEIRHLKAKLDQLASHQWYRLLEIQKLQTEMMEDLYKDQKGAKKP